MKTRKLTVTMLFVASLAWANTASAEEPCGAPVESFTSCEIVQAPDCYDTCDPGAMVDSCAVALIVEEPQECKISCGASCMSDCSAACEASEDKTACFAACSQQCGAQCELTCQKPETGPAPQDVIDSGTDEYQENWGKNKHKHKHHNDDDDDKKGHNDDDDDKKSHRDDDDDDKKSNRDDDDDKKGHNDDDDDWNSQRPATDGLDYGQDPQALVQEGPQECTVSCGASCMNQCAAACEGSDDKTACFASCGSQCDASCELTCQKPEAAQDVIDSGADGYHALIQEGPQECTVSCGASCMNECAAACEISDDKTACFAACGSQCGAQCELTCEKPEAAQNVIDSGTDGYRENWGKHKHNDDDDDDKKGHHRDDDDDDKKGHHNDDDDDDKKSHRDDDDDDHKSEGPAPTGSPDEILNECEVQLTDTCLDACDRGAVLLCDGQYLQVRDVEGCAVALEQAGVAVEGPVAALNLDEVPVDALQGASCSVEEPENLRWAGGLFALLGLGLGAGVLRRRRR
jgi:hypothetical protein